MKPDPRIQPAGDLLPKPKAARRWFWGLVIGAAIIGLVGILRNHFAPPPAEQLAEVSRSALVLRAHQLYLIGHPSPYTGWLVEFYANESLKSRSMVSNGLLHGASEGWHTNRQLAVREHFQEGVSHGPRTKWYATGAKLSEAMIVEGQLQGSFRRWHENGALAEQAELQNGRAEGMAHAFYPSGFLKARANLQDGRPLAQQHWRDGEFREPETSPPQLLSGN